MRSRTEVESPPCPIEESLPPLFLRAFPEDCRPEAAETDVLLVATLNEAESRELVVGVLAYVPDDAEPLLGVKLDRALAVPVFFVDLSGSGEPWVTSSPLVTAWSVSTALSSAMPAEITR